MINRVEITPAAIIVLEQLKSIHGPLMFHQSGGCCDGSQPMCFQLGEFYLGSSDVCLGQILDCPFWMSQDQFEYWRHTQLTIDIVDGRGSSFSLEIPLGKRFIVRSRLFLDTELNQLTPLTYKED
ncbi:MAG: hypothetical protein RLZZ65_583 [Bacteroidota bacterium]|jgi:uncharacterized protein (DUF779 family)